MMDRHDESKQYSVEYIEMGCCMLPWIIMDE